MRELLERWSRLEPNRCYPTTIGVVDGDPVQRWCIPLVGKPSYWWGGTMSEAAVLAAAIEAIEARGWTCSLTHNLVQPGTWRAIVWASTARPGTRTYHPSRASDANTPAAALLGAYLAALEAERSEQ